MELRLELRLIVLNSPASPRVANPPIALNRRA
jgi:hypothetical protein